MTWGPLHASAFTGSMFGADPICWCVMHYAVAVASPEDVVELNPSLLAPMFNSSRETVENAIIYLTSPDPNSRTEDEEGRRLLHIGAFSYHVVNREKYRALIKEEARREYFREKKREYRGAQRDVQDKSNPVSDSPQMSTGLYISNLGSNLHLEEEGVEREEGEKRPKKQPPSYQKDAGFMAIWEAYPRSRRVGALKAFQALGSARKRPDYPGDEQVLERLQLLVEEDWRYREPKFIPHPTTWLNRDGWADEPSAPSWDERRELAKKHAVSGHYDMNAKIDPKLGI